MTFLPVTQMSAIWHACEPIARKIEITRPRLYGRRNERSRPNVRRYGTALTPLNVATGSDPLEPRELLSNEGGRLGEPSSVRRVVEPAARARRMGERDDRRAVELVALADAGCERGEPEQPPQRQPADRDDQAGSQQLQLPLPPEGAKLLLARRGRAVTAARFGAARIAARNRGAIERGVELVLPELEPATQRLARTP